MAPKQTNETNRARSKRAYEKRYRIKYTERYMISATRGSARRSNKEHTLTVEDITVPEICPILGIKLEISERGFSDNSPSLDRIDNSKGYVPGNVAVISWRANRLKASGSAEEHRRIAEYIETRCWGEADAQAVSAVWRADPSYSLSDIRATLSDLLFNAIENAGNKGITVPALAYKFEAGQSHIRRSLRILTKRKQVFRIKGRDIGFTGSDAAWRYYDAMKIKQEDILFS